MRTTLRLTASSLQQAKALAQRRRTTVTALLEEGLRMVLSNEAEQPKRITLPVSKVGGGLQPGVDLSNNAALLDILEARP